MFWLVYQSMAFFGGARGMQPVQPSAVALNIALTLALNCSIDRKL